MAIQKAPNAPAATPPAGPSQTSPTKTTGIVIRGTGAATKGKTARGPMA